MSRSRARPSVWLIIPLVMIMLAWTTALPAAARASTTDSGSEPCPGSSSQLHLGTTTPVLLVHGFNEGPGVFTSGSPSLENAITKAVGSAVTLVTFDYSNWSLLWVTFDQIGPQLARCITWLAHASRAQGGPGKVVIVAHSMGGLAVRCAVDPTCAKGIQAADTNLIGLVITLGTPNLGSNPQTLGPVGDSVCTLFSQCNDLLILRDSPAAQAMAPSSGDLARLPLLPASIPVDAIAGSIAETTSLFGHTYVVGNDGDIVVPVASALADARQGALHAGPGAGNTTVNCGSIPASDISWYHESLSLKAPAPPVTCWHLTETTDARWQGDIITAIKAYLAARLTPPCTSAVLSSALSAANVPLVLPGNWVVQDYACQSGYALAELGGNGYPVAAVFKQQGASWTFVYVLGEFNYCLTEQNGSIIHSCKGGPSQALLQSLTQKANSASVTPEFYVHNGYELGSLYKYPDFPARIGLNNGAYLSGLQWTQVGPGSATATGTLNVNNCIPDCAAGTYVQYSVRLLASDPRQCNVAVYAPYSDVSQEVQAYVFNQIQVAALSGNPPSAYVGTSPPDLPAACG